MSTQRLSLKDSPAMRWIVLFIVAFTMMIGYLINDIMSPLESLLCRPVSEGGLGWSSSDYGFFSGAGSLINVYLLMLFFSGLILDKMGTRFTGLLACVLMIVGVLTKLYAITHSFGDATVFIPIYNNDIPVSAALASLGFSIFGVGYEMCGITVSKAMVRWFTGHELAMAMGIQLAMARLGTAAALSVSVPLARHFTLSAPMMAGLVLLFISIAAWLIFCVFDKRLDKQTGTVADHTAASDTEDDEKFHFSDLGATLRNPGFWLITLFCVLFYSALNPFLKFATRLMEVKYNVPADVAGIFTSIAPFTTIILTPLFGRIYDRYGRGVTIIIIGTAILATAHFGFSLPFHSSFVAISLILLFSIGYSLTPAALWPCVPKIIPLRCLGTAYAMIFFIQNFGRSIIPMLVGRANETDPSYTTSMIIFAITALGAMFVAIAMLFVDRKKGYGLQKPNIKSEAN